MKSKPRTWLLLALLVPLTSCYTDRIVALEKQNKELAAKLDQQQRVADLDLQEKCSSASLQYFKRNWSLNPKDSATTRILDYRNHYNRSLEKCFILVDWSYDIDKRVGSWSSRVSLYDVFENRQYGEAWEGYGIPGHPVNKVACEVDGEKCNDRLEFDQKIKHYLID